MNTISLKELIIDAVNDSIDLESGEISISYFATLLDSVLEDFTAVKPLPWKILQHSKGLQAITPFGSYCIAHTLKGFEVSNTFPGYRKAPKQYGTTVEEAKELCQQDLAKRLKELIE